MMSNVDDEHGRVIYKVMESIGGDSEERVCLGCAGRSQGHLGHWRGRGCLGEAGSDGYGSAVTGSNGVCKSVDAVNVGGGVALDAVIGSGEKVHVVLGRKWKEQLSYIITTFPRLDHDVVY
jgi:hypothetical protein